MIRRPPRSTPCTLGQFMKSLHMHTGLTATFPMDGAPLCAHHTPFPSTFCQFSCTQALPRMFRIRSHRRIWTQSPTLSPTVWSDSASTLAPEALLLGGWHTHWRPTTTPQLPPATFHSCTVSSIIVSWKNSNYYTTFSVSKGVIQRKESRPRVTTSPNDKQIDLTLCLLHSKP